MLEVHADRHEQMIAGKAEWQDYKPDHVWWQFELVVDRLRAEAAWCLRIAERIEGGAGMHAHEQSTDEMMRVWRESMGSVDEVE